MSGSLAPDECLNIIAQLAQLLPRILCQGRVQPAPDGGLVEEGSLPVRRTWDPVFIGGGIVKLLITDPAAPPPSRTKDLDLVLEHPNDDQRMLWDAALRKAEFTQDPFSEDDPLFAWYFQGVRIDFLPDKDSEMFGRTNRWFHQVMKEAQFVEIKGVQAWIASAPCFLATKFEAYKSRGKGDYLGSKDMEDIIAVVDGRSELTGELAQADLDVRTFVSRCCQDLCTDERFLDALASLVIDPGREQEVFGRLQAMAALRQGAAPGDG